MTIEVLVKLAARDPWSFTVLDALVHKFGISKTAGVERLKSWRIDFDLDSEGKALELTSRILGETALLANPNRDIWTVRGRSGTDVPEAFIGGQPGNGCAFAVRVTDIEDIVGRSMHSIIRRRLSMPEVNGVRYSLLWVLRFEAGEEDFRDLAGEIAVARSWRKGLLANPHSQEAHVASIEEFIAQGAGGP
jgi:hypothetical protein